MNCYHRTWNKVCVFYALVFVCQSSNGFQIARISHLPCVNGSWFGVLKFAESTTNPFCEADVASTWPYIIHR